MGLDVSFISDNGAIDYNEDWLQLFISEFRKSE